MKNVTTVGFLDSNPSDKRIIEHLRKVKEASGDEIKTQISKAVIAFYDVYAIGDNPDTTQEEFEKVLQDCWIELSSHISRVALYAKNHKYNVNLSYPYLALIDPITASQNLTALVTSQLASTELASIDGVDGKPLSKSSESHDEDQDYPIVASVEAKKEDIDDDDDDDDDEYAGMSDEEYLKATEHMNVISAYK